MSLLGGRASLLHYAPVPIILLTVLAASAVAGQGRLNLRGFLVLVPGWTLALLAAGLAYAMATFLIFAPASGAGDHGRLHALKLLKDHFVRLPAGLRFGLCLLAGTCNNPNVCGRC